MIDHDRLRALCHTPDHSRDHAVGVIIFMIIRDHA